MKYIICSVIPNSVFWILFHNKPEFQHLRRIAMRIFGAISKYLPSLPK